MAKNRNKKYMMHKYWGKKPADELNNIVQKYSFEKDLLLDPFAGYGGFSSEAVLLNRNVISNDLNPISNFINKVLLLDEIDFKKVDDMIKILEFKVKSYEEKWYSYDGKIITTALRTQKDEIINLRIKEGKKIKEVGQLDKSYIGKYEDFEKNYKITEWFPKDKLIINSRISARDGMTIVDLFPKRALACHAKLLSVIHEFENGNEKDLFLLAFTSNVANCSKLVPPIKSRGEMSQGAWMTGFYIGETYLENNVFHYYINRIKKIMAGKKEYLEELELLADKGEFKITNEDAKKLSIADNTIDLVFTDFPYGDAVPYFEQSVLWNAWMKFNVNYEDEIVISDSKDRKKTKEEFKKEIYQAIFEINRVLKENKYFIFTFHSLSGFEWSVLVNSLIKIGFVIEDSKLLVQKTLPPRQLTRKNTVKGDMLVVCKKECSDLKKDSLSVRSKKEIQEIFKKIIQRGAYYTNDIIVYFLKEIFRERYLIGENNIFNELGNVADFDGEGWILK